MTNPADGVIDLTMGRKQNYDQISFIEFECPACNQQVKGNRGYYVEHMVTVISPYGVPEERFCPTSNNRIQAPLRTLKMSGDCENCGLHMDVKLEEEYPGGLKQEGGWLETTCTACNGLTEATCEHCGATVHANEDPGTRTVLVGCVAREEITAEWVHEDGKAECPNQVLAQDDDEDDEELDSEFFTPAPKEPVKASPLDGTIHTNPLSKVVVHDGFSITITEDETPHQDQEEV